LSIKIGPVGEEGALEGETLRGGRISYDGVLALGKGRGEEETDVQGGGNRFWISKMSEFTKRKVTES